MFGLPLELKFILKLVHLLIVLSVINTVDNVALCDVVKNPVV